MLDVRHRTRALPSGYGFGGTDGGCDYSAAATALDALSEGFRTIVIEDACRGVDEGDIEKKMAAIRENNGVIVHSSKVGRSWEDSEKRGLIVGPDKVTGLG